MTRIQTRSEPFYSVRQAAKDLGLSYSALLRAVNAGRIPSYRPFNSRRLVLIDEVREAVRRHQSNGQARSGDDCRDTIGDLFEGGES